VASYYEQDGIGSVSAVSNSVGALVNTYAYDSFGKLNASSGSLANPFQYTGREFDPETGIYEYRNRYYDPGTGRFVSEDPMGFEAGNDFYIYAENNPVNLTDSSGLSVDVYCENVVQGHYGLKLGASHCRVQVNLGHFCDSLEWVPPNLIDTPCYKRPGYPAKVKRPCDSATFENCVLSAFQDYAAYPQKLGTYNYWTNNSDLFIQRLIEGCGGHVHFPYVAPVFPPWRTYGKPGLVD